MIGNMDPTSRLYASKGRKIGTREMCSINLLGTLERKEHGVVSLEESGRVEIDVAKLQGLGQIEQ